MKYLRLTQFKVSFKSSVMESLEDRVGLHLQLMTVIRTTH